MLLKFGSANFTHMKASHFLWLGCLFFTAQLHAQWTRITVSGQGFLSQVCFPSAQHGYIVSAQPDKVLHSSDNGNTWQALSFPDTAFFPRTVFFLNDSTGYVGGSVPVSQSITGRIYRTTDHGRSWTDISPDSAYNILLLRFKDPQHGVATEFSGKIYTTADAGASWTVTKNDGIYHQVSWPGDHCFIGGDNFTFVPATPWGGRIYKSVSGGPWQEQVFPVSADGGLDNSVTDLQFFDDQRGYALLNGNKNKLIYTNNAGSSWDTVNATIGRSFVRFLFTDTATGWFLYANQLFRTTDGGRNISLFYTADSLTYLRDIAQVNGVYYITGTRGELYKYDPAHTGMAYTAMNTATLNLYPNPADVTGTLHIDLQATTPARLTLLDATGRTVYSTTLKAQQVLDIDLGALHLAPGTYHVQLSSRDLNSCKKLVLVRY